MSDEKTAVPGSDPVSDLAQLRRHLADREAFYRNVLESLGDGVLITDEGSRIVYANSKVEEITGYPRAEMLGRVSYELLTPREQWPAMQRRLQERLAGREEQYEHEHVRRDGSRHWVSVRAVPYRDAEGRILGTIGTLSCIARQKSLERQNEYLQDELRERGDFGELVGRGPGLRKVLDQMAMVAPTEAGVLILGESGTGKELVAHAIHERSLRRERALVRVNCAAVPRELFESEFFGHVRGAFTGALRDRVGRFELADGGTLFLDEVGEIPMELQGKLLRVLQEGQFEKVGEDRTRAVNVRLLAATNRDLLAEARAGRFRLDLYYRLSVFPIEVPPLRERREDIAPLAEHFLGKSARRLGMAVPRLTADALRGLEAYDWPGNVRELQNVIERAVILAGRSGRVQFELGASGGRAARAVPGAARGGQAPAVGLRSLRQQEVELITQVLSETGGRIYGPDGAAARLGMKPTTLASRVQRWGLRQPARQRGANGGASSTSRLSG